MRGKIIQLVACIVFIVNFQTLSFCQNWKKYIGSKTYTGVCAIESYDHGFYVLGVNYSTVYNSILYKTDINGNILWQRIIGVNFDSMAVSGMTISKEGGLVLIGSKSISPFRSNVYLVKINNCGEKEWVKIYMAQRGSGSICKIIQLKNGNYVFTNPFSGILNNFNSWVFETDKMGLLKNQYYSTMTINDIYSYDSVNTIVTGTSTLPSLKNPNKYQNVYSISKLDSQLNLYWTTNYSIPKEISGAGYSTISTPDKGFLTLGAKGLGGFESTSFLLKCDENGSPLWDKLIGDTTLNEDPVNICIVNDSTFIATIQRSDPPKNSYDFNLKIIKFNANGAILIEKLFPDNLYYQLNARIRPTSDGKFLICGMTWPKTGSGVGPIFVYKINSNLELDSFYSQKISYDYFCNQSIIQNETISIVGDTINVYIPSGINSEEINNIQLQVFPNPAHKILELRYKSLENNPIEICIFDLTGKIVLQQKVAVKNQGINLQKIDLSSVKNGLYFVEVIQGSFKMVDKIILE